MAKFLQSLRDAVNPDRSPDSSRPGAVEDANGQFVVPLAQLAGEIDGKGEIPAIFAQVMAADLLAIQVDLGAFVDRGEDELHVLRRCVLDLEPPAVPGVAVEIPI